MIGSLFLLWMLIVVRTIQGTTPERQTTIRNETQTTHHLSSPTFKHNNSYSDEPNRQTVLDEKSRSTPRKKREYPFEENDKSNDKRESSRRRFSSWGGKRNYEENDLIDNLNPDKKSKFSSWAGKRDFRTWTEKQNDDYKSILEEKRAKFNSWAGKRYDMTQIKKPIYPYGSGKRARFNSWAGKRSEDDSKRSTFNSWAGKRADDEQSEIKRSPDYVKLTENNKNRLQYYPNFGGNSDSVLKLWQDYMSRKRARFSSWAGKRSQPFTSFDEEIMKAIESDNVNKDGKFNFPDNYNTGQIQKRKFSSWGGKRSENDSTGIEERDYFTGSIVKRSTHPWDHKKTPLPWTQIQRNGHTIQARSLQRVRLGSRKDRSWSSLLRPIRRGPDFYAWGGKRSA